MTFEMQIDCYYLEGKINHLPMLVFADMHT